MKNHENFSRAAYNFIELIFSIQGGSTAITIHNACDAIVTVNGLKPKQGCFGNQKLTRKHS